LQNSNKFKVPTVYSQSKESKDFRQNARQSINHKNYNYNYTLTNNHESNDSDYYHANKLLNKGRIQNAINTLLDS